MATLHHRDLSQGSPYPWECGSVPWAGFMQSWWQRKLLPAPSLQCRPRRGPGGGSMARAPRCSHRDMCEAAGREGG
jgi:hypothetical protein